MWGILWTTLLTLLEIIVLVAHYFLTHYILNLKSMDRANCSLIEIIVCEKKTYCEVPSQNHILTSKEQMTSLILLIMKRRTKNFEGSSCFTNTIVFFYSMDCGWVIFLLFVWCNCWVMCCEWKNVQWLSH